MNEYYNESIKVSFFSIILNILLSLFKLIAGIIGMSNAMISDAIHSISDVVSTIIVMVGLKVSNKDDDNTHQYGHERFEAIASLFLGFLLIITSIYIGIEGIKKIILGINGNIKTPTIIALIASIVSIVVKEIMYQITKKVAIKTNSSALMADAWHHRSDALSSIGSLIGVALSMLGLSIFDPIVSIIICLIIFKVSIDIIKSSIYKLVDTSISNDKIKEMKNIIESVDGVMGIDLIKTRIFGSKIYVDLEISADKNQTLESAHNIANLVHDKIEEKFSDVKHCMIHVNPK